MADPLEDGEELLVEEAELLWRNQHPSFVDEGARPTSQLFRLTPNDEGKLSSARSTRVSAAEHHREYTEDFGLESVAVWAVSVGEVHAVDLRAICDEHAATAPSPCPTGHSYLDLRGVGGGRARRLAGQLRDSAIGRGQQHP